MPQQPLFSSDFCDYDWPTFIEELVLCIMEEVSDEASFVFVYFCIHLCDIAVFSFYQRNNFPVELLLLKAKDEQEFK